MRILGEDSLKLGGLSLKAVHVAAKVQTAALPALYPGQWGWPRRPAQVVALSFEELQLG